MIWKVETGGSVYGPATWEPPEIPGGQGFVYIGSFDGYVYKIDAGTGEVKWKSNIYAHGDCGIVIGSGKANNVLILQSGEGGNCTHWPPPPDSVGKLKFPGQGYC